MSRLKTLREYVDKELNLLEEEKCTSDASNLPEKFLKYYPMFKAGSINVTDFANLLSCSRVTIYKYIRLKEQTVKHK